MADLTLQNTQALIIMWIFTWLAIIIMAVRLLMRKVRRQDFDNSDYVTMAAIFCMMLQNGLVHVELIWGTNIVAKEFRTSHLFTSQEIYQREVGSKLAFGNRAVCNTYIWLQKVVVMFLYRRLLFGIQWAEIMMNIYWIILAVTYVVIQVVVFTECMPIYLYWQVLPDPGTCIQAFRQLTVFGVLNIFTDVMLIVLPMPTFLKVKRSRTQRFKLVVIFSIGLLTVGIAIGRVTFDYSAATALASSNSSTHTTNPRVYRQIWTSAESLAAAIVANLPTLYSLCRISPNFSKNTGILSGSSKKSSNSRTKFSGQESGFQQIKDQSILVTKGIELDDQKIRIPANLLERLNT